MKRSVVGSSPPSRVKRRHNSWTTLRLQPAATGCNRVPRCPCAGPAALGSLFFYCTGQMIRVSVYLLPKKPQPEAPLLALETLGSSVMLQAWAPSGLIITFEKCLESKPFLTTTDKPTLQCWQVTHVYNSNHFEG